ncbi:GtrA family protein [Salinimicrobium soli]|uniref:GtrA family protein n=1 Tax=Salinimicrobium soli TaxID=1254399 RepID=UPI003AAEE1EE
MNFLYSRKLISLFAGFSGVGVFTTLLSLGAIYFFIEVLKTPLISTYAAIYFSTILLSYFLNSCFVFKSSLGKRKAVRYFVIYLSGMILGVIVLRIFEFTLPFDDFVLAYLVLPITMIWNFILVYKLFNNKHSC